MSSPERPEQRASLPEARILWAGSFLSDWLIPLLENNRIHSRNDIVRLREGFPPLKPENEKGTDFTLDDVMTAALREREYYRERYPYTSEDKLPNGKVLLRAIDLLSALDQDEPPKSEDWTQTSFPTN